MPQFYFSYWYVGKNNKFFLKYKNRKIKDHGFIFYYSTLFCLCTPTLVLTLGEEKNSHIYLNSNSTR
jgi:hypothetical protein